MPQMKQGRERQVDLLHGPILKTLTKLSLPIMATAFLQVAYNLVDTLWIGRLGASEVAAVGTAGMFLWFSEGILLLARMGGQVFTARELGAGREEEARSEAAASLLFAAFLGAVVAGVLFFFRGPLIGFFNLTNPATIREAKIYLSITGIGVFFAYLGRQLTVLSIASGDSSTPFKVNTLGLVLNMILDPVLIFVAGWGVAGAAWATFIAQVTVAVFLALRVLGNEPYIRLPFREVKRNLAKWPKMFKLGIPAAAQTMGFSFISMIVARMVAGFGEAAIAAQKVGSQIESISWLTADGFASALTAFIAQNYGNNRLDRTKEAYYKALGVISIIGLLNTAILYFGDSFLFSIFLKEPEVIAEGARYLRILALSQLFMCAEILSGAAFNGFGKTLFPSLVILTGVISRIPIGYWLSSTELQVAGLWWAISGTSIFMGVVMVFSMHRFLKRQVPSLPRPHFWERKKQEL